MRKIILKVFYWLWLLLFWGFISIVVLLVTVSVAINIPAVQQWAVNASTDWFDETTGGSLSIGHLDLRIPYYIGIDELSLLGPEGDHIADMDELKLSLGWRQLLNKKIVVDQFAVSGLKTNIDSDTLGVWNYDFIIDAFAGDDVEMTEEGLKTDEDSAWDVVLHKLMLHDIDLRYSDASSRDSIVAKFGKLSVHMNEFSLRDNVYKADKIHFANSRIHAQLGGREEVEEETTNDTLASSATLPEMFLEHLLLENHQVYFTQLSDGSSYKLTLKSLSLKPDAIDIEQSVFVVDAFKVEGLDLEMRVPESLEEPQPFDGDIFVPLTLNAKSVSIANVDFRMHTFNILNIDSDSNTSIAIEDVTLQLADLEITPERYAFHLESAQIVYDGLPNLSNIAGAFSLTPTRASIDNFTARFGQSDLSTSANLSYPGLGALANDLDFNEIRLNLRRASIHPDDIAALLTYANPDSALPALPRLPIIASMALAGNGRAINLSSFKARTGETVVELNGNSSGPRPAEHEIKLESLKLFAKLADLSPWLPDSIDRGILPSSITYNGKASAGPKSSKIKGLLKLPPFGDFELSFASGGWDSEQYNLNGSINTSMVDLKTVVESDTFYTCFELSVDLFDLTGDNMYGFVKVDIPQLRKDNLMFSNLIATDSINGDFHRFAVQANDSTLVASITGTALLGDDIEIHVSSNIQGADFEYIGITKNDVRLQTYLTASYFQRDSLQKGSLDVGQSVVVRGDERIDLQPISVDFFLGPDSTGLEIVSELLMLKSVSNLSLDALIETGKDLFKDDVDKQTHQEGYWNFDFKSAESALLRELLLPDLHHFEPAKGSVQYDAGKRLLVANFTLPQTGYGNMSIDSLSLKLISDQGSTTGTFSVLRAAYDTLAIDHINLKMDPDTAGTTFRFTLGAPPASAPYDLRANLIHHLEASHDYWELKPLDTLKLAGKLWNIDDAAYLRFMDEGTAISALNLSRKQQRLSFSKEGAAETLNIAAQRFNLGSLAEIFTQDEALFGGILNAGMALNSDGTFVGDGVIEGLVLAGVDFGTFSFEGEADQGLYSLSAKIDGDELRTTAGGTVEVNEDGSQKLDIKVEITEFKAQSLQSIIPSIVANAEGVCTGTLTITGSSDEPMINGSVQFNNIALTLKGSGQYALKKEELRIEPQSIVFPNFSILDSAGNKLTVNGNINHKNFENMRYDLTIKSDRFTLLDVKQNEHPMFYGKLVVGSNIRITGTQAFPVIRSDISLLRGSQMVFMVPESNYSTFDDDGLIEWLSFNDTTELNIIGRDKTEGSPVLTETILDLAGNLNIDKETKFRIIIDPLAGDYLEIEGGGRLALGYDRAGRINLSGTYTVSSGAYQMTFYNIVKRKFLLEPGSRITWNGDPFSADLNLTAIYPTRASAMGLLNTAAGGGGEGMRRMLDWEVLMLITGEIEQPEIAFDLRLDKGSQSSRGTMAGAIESRLVQLRDNESELNMQVFALMVFNSFISEGGGGMSSGDMMTNQARNSASQLLTQQLNNMSDKLVNGVELTFDLQSYGSEGASETDLSVDLSKTLFNDRVVVRLGSTVALEQNDPLADNSQQMMTNFIVEYKLTTDGRYRLKAFRKTDVEDILVGRITRTGAGIVFRRSFDRGDQIFQKDQKEKELEAEIEAEKKRTLEENKKNNDREKNGEQ